MDHIRRLRGGRMDWRATLLALAQRGAPTSTETTASTPTSVLLHEVIAREHGVGVSLASMLLDAGGLMDVRDEFLKSTPLGWACRWGRVELVELLLARGAYSVEPEAEPWATPLAWRTQSVCTHAIRSRFSPDRDYVGVETTDTQIRHFTHQMRTDLPSTAKTFAVAFFVIQGRDDVMTPTRAAVDYFNGVTAPTKKLILIPDAGHFAFMTASGAFLSALIDTVRPVALASGA